MKQRDGRMDCLKGIAIILVLLGHIVQYGFEDGTDTPLFNVIWTLQIPLFMLVSGYFGGSGDLRNIPKRGLAYLVPYASFFVIWNLVVTGHYDLIERLSLLVHDIQFSLWYLLVLFFLSTAHTLAEHFGTGSRTGLGGHVGYTLCYGLCLLPFGVLALLVDPRFLGSYLVLYYAPFFYLGRMWRVLSRGDKMTKNVCGGGTKAGLLQVTTPLALVGYLAIVSQVNTVWLEDTLPDMLLRATASLCGCYVVIRLVFAAWQEKAVLARGITYLGRNSLRLYYYHALFIPFIKKLEVPMHSAPGMGCVAIYFVATLLMCGLLELVSRASPWLKTILFGEPLKGKD